MRRPEPINLILGSAAGAVGTLALLGLRTASERVLPSTMPPISGDPGQLLLQEAEHRFQLRLPGPLTKVLAAGLALGYGVSAGAVYGLLRRKPQRVWLEGTTLGTATWAAGYAGWLPAFGFMAPLSQQSRSQVLGPLVRHVAFGVVVVAVYGRWVHRRQP